MRSFPRTVFLLTGAWMAGCHGKIEGGSHDDQRRDGGEADVDAAAGTQPDMMVSVVTATSAPIVITEIMYHPVFENADQESHEFVEIYNRSKDPVALDGWTLATANAGISFSFPKSTTIMPGQYRVVAKNRQLLAKVYGLQEGALLGDYAGELDNGGAVLSLADASGQTVDLVNYDDKRPWPVSADALGVSEEWLPVNQQPITKHQYKGRSLERISTEIDSNTPANWEASALDGATPGKKNSVAGAAVPIVEILYAAPQGGTGSIIRNSDGVVITARFSLFAGVPPPSAVEVEYFVDSVTKTAMTTMNNAMTPQADGSFTASIPAQPDNSVVRYRINAVRGDKSGVAAPRTTDPLQWFAYFVSPKVFVKPGVESKARTYHMFIRPEEWTKLETALNVLPETGVDYCDLNPNWNTTVSATFISEGQVYDVRVRYEGGKYLRYSGGIISDWKYPGPAISRPLDSPGAAAGNQLMALSWRIKFPRYDRFEGRRSGLVMNKMAQGCPGTVTYVESKLLEKAGIPSYREDFGRLHINGGYYHYVALPEDIDDTFLRRVYPDEAVIGDLFKNDGSNNRGPSGKGDYLPLGTNPLCPRYTIQDRYVHTYPRQNYQYRSHDELIKLITDLDAARTTAKAAGNQAAVRAYFMKYWDWQALLSIFVIRNWSGAWDDVGHNNFPFKRPSTGKWIPIQQDFEWDFGLGRYAFVPRLSPYDANETLYIGWDSPDLSISDDCELPYVPGRERCNWIGFSSLKDAFIGAFKTEFDDKMRELTTSPNGLLSTEAVSKVIDEAVAAFSVEDWLADPSLKLCNVEYGNASLYAWAHRRNATVARNLGSSNKDGGVAVPVDAGSPPIGNGGGPIDWTKCSGGYQPSVSAADFCNTYEKTCGFETDAGVVKYASKADCLAKYRTSDMASCLAGQLCYAFAFGKANDSYCSAAAALVQPCTVP